MNRWSGRQYGIGRLLSREQFEPLLSGHDVTTETQHRVKASLVMRLFAAECMGQTGFASPWNPVDAASAEVPPAL